MKLGIFGYGNGFRFL